MNVVVDERNNGGNMAKKKLTKKQKRSKYNQSLDDKLVYNNIRFRSKLEVNHYKYFLEHPNIEVLEFEPYFLLLEPFEYYCIESGKTRKYGKFSYKADFKLKIDGLDRLVIWESKGLIKPEFAIRKKIWYSQYGDDYYYILSKSLKHAKKVIEDILSRGD
jgi:hypothetical protein